MDDPKFQVGGIHIEHPWWQRVVQDPAFRSDVSITMTRLVRQVERAYLSGELTATRYNHNSEGQAELTRIQRVAENLSKATTAVYNGQSPDALVAELINSPQPLACPTHPSAARRVSTGFAPRRYNTRQTLEDSVLFTTLPAVVVTSAPVPTSSLSSGHLACVEPVLRAIAPKGDSTLRRRAYGHLWRPFGLSPHYVPLLAPQRAPVGGSLFEEFEEELRQHHAYRRSREQHHGARANRFLRQSRALQLLNRGERPCCTESDDDDDRGCVRSAYGSVPFEGGRYQYPSPNNHPPDIYSQPALVDVLPPPGFVLSKWAEPEIPTIAAASCFAPLELAGEGAARDAAKQHRTLPIEAISPAAAAAVASLSGNSAEVNWVFRHWVGRQRDAIYKQVLHFIVGESPSGSTASVGGARYTNISSTPLFAKLSTVDRRLLSHYPASLVGYDGELPLRLRTDLDPRTFGVFQDGLDGDALFDFPSTVKTVSFKKPRKQWRLATGSRRSVFSVCGKRRAKKGSTGVAEICTFRVSARAVFSCAPETDFYLRLHDDLATRVYEVPIVEVPLGRRRTASGGHHEASRQQLGRKLPLLGSYTPHSRTDNGQVGSSGSAVSSGVPPRKSPRVAPFSIHPPVPTVHECNRRWALTHDMPLPAPPRVRPGATTSRGARPTATPSQHDNVNAGAPPDGDEDERTRETHPTCQAPLPPRYLGSMRPSMRLTRWHLWCDAIRQRYAEESRQMSEAVCTPVAATNSSTPVDGHEAVAGFSFLGTLRGKQRLQYYADILGGIPDHRAPQETTVSTEGVLGLVESPPLHGFGRYDLTVHRHDALYRSTACRQALRRLYCLRERDPLDAHLNKVGFVGFVLDLNNLIMPCNRSRYNIACAEDEWRLYSAFVFQRDASSVVAKASNDVGTTITDQFRSLEQVQQSFFHKSNALRLGHTLLTQPPLASVPPETLLTSIDSGNDVVLPPYTGDFDSFFDFFFSFPLMAYHGEVVTEELYVGFWGFVYDCWYGPKPTTNEDRYDRYLLRTELAPVVESVQPGRRAFLVNRVADTLEDDTHRPRAAKATATSPQLEAFDEATTSDDDSCQSDFPSLEYQQKQRQKQELHNRAGSEPERLCGANEGVISNAVEDHIPPSSNPVATEARSAYSLFKAGGVGSPSLANESIAMRIYDVAPYERDELDNLIDFHEDISSASSESFSSDTGYDANDAAHVPLPRGSLITRMDRADWDDTMSLSKVKAHRARERYEAMMRRRDLLRRSVVIDTATHIAASPLTVDEAEAPPVVDDGGDVQQEEDTQSYTASATPALLESCPIGTSPSAPIRLMQLKPAGPVAVARDELTTLAVAATERVLETRLHALRAQQRQRGPVCAQQQTSHRESEEVVAEVFPLPPSSVHTPRPQTVPKQPPRPALFSLNVSRIVTGSGQLHPVERACATGPVSAPTTPRASRSTPLTAMFFMSRPTSSVRASRPSTAPSKHLSPHRDTKELVPEREHEAPDVVELPQDVLFRSPRTVPARGTPRCLLPRTDLTNPAVKSNGLRHSPPRSGSAQRASTDSMHPPPGPLQPSFIDPRNESRYGALPATADEPAIQTFYGKRQQGHFFTEAAGTAFDPSPHKCPLAAVGSNVNVSVSAPKAISITSNGVRVRPPPRPSAALVSLINLRNKAQRPSALTVPMVKGTPIKQPTQE